LSYNKIYCRAAEEQYRMFPCSAVNLLDYSYTNSGVPLYVVYIEMSF